MRRYFYSLLRKYITLFVLEGAGHNQNVEPNREQLWERISDWVIDLARRGARRPSKRT